jgi:hypothetical protein
MRDEDLKNQIPEQHCLMVRVGSTRETHEDYFSLHVRFGSLADMAVSKLDLSAKSGH